MNQQLKAQVEAILFANGEPVKIEKLSKFLKISNNDCNSIIEEMGKLYQQNNSGLDFVFKDGEVQLVSARQYGKLVAKFLDRQLNEELSRAAAEVLAVVAYRGPLTRAQIEQIRGVNCSFTLRNLAIRGLVDRKDNPGDSRTYLYEISFNFLKSLGISTVKELPDFENLSKALVIDEKTIEEGVAQEKQKKETTNEKQDN